jgi:hypothetical protein
MAASASCQFQTAMSTPTKKPESTPCSTALLEACSNSAGHDASSLKNCHHDVAAPLQPPHPHDICDLDIRGAMQVAEDASPGGGAGKHTEYALSVQLYCGLSYSVSRRYNEFYELDKQLQKLFPGIMLPELPPRSLLASSILNQMDSRCAALNRYVKVNQSHVRNGFMLMFSRIRALCAILSSHHLKCTSSWS